MPKISRVAVISELEQQGKSDQVGKAKDLLPDPVDTEQHGDLLAQLGLDPAALGDRHGRGQG